jgi:hypothetical protein
MIRIDRIVSFTYPRRETAVVGWCCLDDFAAVDELWVEHAGGRLHCLSRIPRPDVVRAYKAPSLAHSGFICRYPGAPSDPVTLIARLGDTEHALGTLSSHAWPQAVEFPEAATNEYATWLRTREPKLHSPTADGHLVLGRLTVAPLISVIVPVYNTSLYHLQRCIDSVAAQLYPNWELCLTDDASTDPRVPAYLQERAARDSRIRLSLSAQNGGISAASNIAVAGSSGEFAVRLDHDDELHPAALLEVVRCLDAHGDADLIYTDEDKIDQIGVRSQPAFKPEFDEDLLCGFDYFGHLVAIRTARRTGICCCGSRRRPAASASGTSPSRSTTGGCTRSPRRSASMRSHRRYAPGTSC